MSTIIRASFVLLGIALASHGVVACKSNEACERARMETSTVWKGITDSAARMKLQGLTGYEELSQDKKAEHYRSWNDVEKGAEGVFNAFAFEKITWTTAEPSKQKANDAFDAYFDKATYTSFKLALDDANKKYDGVAKLCK